MIELTCPLDGCNEVFEAPDKASAMTYLALYEKLERHVIEKHAIRQLIQYFWRKALLDAGMKF